MSIKEKLVKNQPIWPIRWPILSTTISAIGAENFSPTSAACAAYAAWINAILAERNTAEKLSPIRAGVAQVERSETWDRRRHTSSALPDFTSFNPGYAAPVGRSRCVVKRSPQANSLCCVRRQRPSSRRRAGRDRRYRGARCPASIWQASPIWKR